MAVVRITYQKSCDECGKVFTARRSRQNYCTKACRYKAWEKKHPRTVSGMLAQAKADDERRRRRRIREEGRAAEFLAAHSFVLDEISNAVTADMRAKGTPDRFKGYWVTTQYVMRLAGVKTNDRWEPTIKRELIKKYPELALAFPSRRKA